LTGLWENKLRRIERGEFSAAEFITELKGMMQQIVVSVLSDNSNRQIDAGQNLSAGKKDGAGAAQPASSAS
ncbi:MAG TPA: DNA topoisomerase III, partial [Porphyromonadaceae bacterium]|nr:DNA topoisomerase III [Porphyromonadaceae bacterium]